MKQKSFLAALLLLVTCLTVQAQKVKINLVDGQTFRYDVEKVESITFDENVEFVDLGLPSGTLWASCNIGAAAPEDYGDYFAWGETKTKAMYGPDTYKWMNYWEKVSSTVAAINKYTVDDSYNGIWYSNGVFVGDGITTLLPEDDAATANWGSDWQTPTSDQFLELKQYTTQQWTTRTGKDGFQNHGYLFTSKKNGNYIFIPAAGLNGYDSTQGEDEVFRYWSASLYIRSYEAKSFVDYTTIDDTLPRGELGNDGFGRYIGLPVRPVWKK
ncbi:MAG: hypothetical protein IJ148_05680 [Bacteroidaceae bacterium]|nr:hypothetical protein [Bacteroidaceae bacterium]MBQ9170299.1 hypothetical protein [Bacteroidaceae bacterium]